VWESRITACVYKLPRTDEQELVPTHSPDRDSYDMNGAQPRADDGEFDGRDLPSALSAFIGDPSTMDFGDQNYYSGFAADIRNVHFAAMCCVACASTCQRCIWSTLRLLLLNYALFYV